MKLVKVHQNYLANAWYIILIKRDLSKERKLVKTWAKFTKFEKISTCKIFCCKASNFPLFADLRNPHLCYGLEQSSILKVQNLGFNLNSKASHYSQRSTKQLSALTSNAWW